MNFNHSDIKPISEPGQGRTGRLNGVSFAEVEKVLGFKANVDDDASRVTHSWGFEIEMNGIVSKCGIWDYKGNPDLSTYGPKLIFKSLFGNRYSHDADMFGKI